MLVTRIRENLYDSLMLLLDMKQSAIELLRKFMKPITVNHLYKYTSNG